MTTGLALAKQVRDGEVNATELVQSALDRVAENNPGLNAVTSTRGIEALAEAAVLEDHGQPFLGV